MVNESLVINVVTNVVSITIAMMLMTAIMYIINSMIHFVSDSFNQINLGNVFKINTSMKGKVEKL